MKSRKGLKRIAVALPSGITFVERVLKGVHQYSRERGGWSFLRVPEQTDPSLDWLRGCDSDGALVMASNEKAAKIARSLPMPVVNLSDYMEISDLPTVMVDQKETGRMAARHLLERNLSRFAYYGTSDMWYSQVRRASFVETIEAYGGECAILEVPCLSQSRETLEQSHEELEEWLKELRPPVGIMASTDLRACMAADACANVGLRIPDDVALIGVDNDPAPKFHNPPLSSVSRNDAEVGLRAAALLEHIMDGGAPPPEPILVPPDAIICRHSTGSATTTTSRSRIAKTVAFIHKNVHRPFGVQELLDIASMPRRTFEQHFAEIIGISPYSFILRCRVERATSLLASIQNYQLTEIAYLSGFSDLRRFRMVFHRLMGMTPSAYQCKHHLRRRNRTNRKALC
jgi:LacI family transcriptional regulator